MKTEQHENPRTPAEQSQNMQTAIVPISAIVARWNDPAARPLFKGQLIDETGCMCAQGDILHTFCGWTPQRLRGAEQVEADRATAKALNISVAHAVLLRHVNDSADGAPSIVLTNPERILGDQAPRILKFWRHLDVMTEKDWAAAWAAARAAAGAAWDAAWDAAWAAAWAAAGAAAGAAWDAGAAAGAAWDAGAAAGAAWDAGAAAWDAWAAARAAAWDAGAAARAAAWATNEIQGASKLQAFFFLPAFGFATPADLDALPAPTEPQP
jgi:hypothetical protein